MKRAIDRRLARLEARVPRPHQSAVICFADDAQFPPRGEPVILISFVSGDRNGDSVPGRVAAPRVLSERLDDALAGASRTPPVQHQAPPPTFR
jgi:hypothetical protein